MARPRILALVRNCAECPRRTYYSGGVENCSVLDAALPPKHEREMQTGHPSWCPLPIYPVNDQ